MGKRYWVIEGWDSTTQFYFRKVPVGYITESRIEALLACLAAKYGLSDDEIVSAFAKRNSKIYQPLLETQGASPKLPWSRVVGGNPYFLARVEEVEGK
jgi:hypothetical protein